MKTSTFLTGLATGALAAGVLTTTYAADSAPAPAAAPQGPASVNPADFTDPQPNPYFPLRPGLVTRLRGSDEGEHFREVVRVTDRHRRVEGVRTTVVKDVVRRADGSLAEKTHDWYAADNDGTVWYFGEATATYTRSGQVDDREGSWEAGKDGAVAGIVMPADPRPTDAFRQEFKQGEAEDQAWVVQRNARRTVPAGHFRHVVRSFEWSRLEPRVVAVKFYARGVGIIAERDVAGGDEVFELTKVTRP